MLYNPGGVARKATPEHDTAGGGAATGIYFIFIL